MTAQKLTGADLNKMSQNTFSALVEDEDGTWRIIDKLKGKALEELADTSVILRYPASEWATELIDAERDRLGPEAKAITVRADAAREATAELHAEAKREAVMLPPFWTITELGLSASEHAHWRRIVEGLPPLLLP